MNAWIFLREREVVEQRLDFFFLIIIQLVNQMFYSRLFYCPTYLSAAKVICVLCWNQQVDGHTFLQLKDSFPLRTEALPREKQPSLFQIHFQFIAKLGLHLPLNRIIFICNERAALLSSTWRDSINTVVGNYQIIQRLSAKLSLCIKAL